MEGCNGSPVVYSKNLILKLYEKSDGHTDFYFVIEISSASDEVHGVLKIQQQLPHWSTEVTLCHNCRNLSVVSESFHMGLNKATP
jgi:hypothetical protein